MQRTTAEQVAAAQQAAADQVAALQRQLDDTKAARADDERHMREVERAYVSGGGARVVAQRLNADDDDRLDDAADERSGRIIIRLPDGTRTLRVSTDLFQLHINNHGKTPARNWLAACPRRCNQAATGASPAFTAISNGRSGRIRNARPAPSSKRAIEIENGRVQLPVRSIK
jgi:hypothetical protein